MDCRSLCSWRICSAWAFLLILDLTLDGTIDFNLSCVGCYSKTKLRGLSPQANCADRATVACRRSKCQFLRVEGVAWSAQRILTAVNLGFLDRSLYFFIQVAPQLSSRGWVDPVPDPLLHRKSGRAGNRSRDLWICSQKLWPLDHRGGLM
jgi:hypothetical protein